MLLQNDCLNSKNSTLDLRYSCHTLAARSCSLGFKMLLEMQFLKPFGILVLLVTYAFLRPGVLPWLILIASIVLGLNFVYRQAPRITIKRELENSRTFQGSSVNVSLKLEINAPLPVLMTISEVVPRTLIPDQPAAITGLFWGISQHELKYSITPNARGGFVWTGLEQNWSDPLGLFIKDARIPNPTSEFELLVYPGFHALELPDLARPLLSDGPPSRTWGLEDESTFAGVREYAPGDPQRRVHWKQTARHGMTDGRYNQLIVRELERVAATGVHIHLDLDATGRNGAMFLESATRLASSILREAFEAGLRVSVSSLTGRTEASGSFAALERALAYLALVQLEPQGSQVVPEPSPGANLVIITMNAPTTLIEGAIRARARAARVLVLALSEGYYLEPGESPRPLFYSMPDALKDLEARAGVLEAAGVKVFVLRGDESVLKLALR
jgi:uncharacterized protein (DUF58 family)